MRTIKNYSEEKVSKCPFCARPAIIKNPQKVPVCMKHKKEELKDLKCKCGEYLDTKTGKHGPFFICINCNIVKFKTGLQINEQALRSTYNF